MQHLQLRDNPTCSNFNYNNNTYTFFHDINDATGWSCVAEIVDRNDYSLELFVNRVDTFFIDIGANCGVATIILAKQNPKSTILSFEPYLPAFQLLEKNILANNLTNVKIYNKAVTNNNNNTLNLTTSPIASGANTTYANLEIFTNHFNKFSNDPNYKNINVCTIGCTSLDKIIIEHNITQIELLKIDCEGAEYDILYGSHIFKTNIVKNIVGEFHAFSYNMVDNNMTSLLNYCKIYCNGITQIALH
jgi:FkbM family methyltransferase